MKKILFALIATTTIFTSCKKDGGGGSTTSDSYLPNTTATNWTFKKTSGTTVSNVTYTVTTNAITNNGITYVQASGSDGSNQYYAQIGTDYHNLLQASGQNIDLVILKADKNLNDTWTSSTTIPVTGVPGVTTATVNITYKMLLKGGTRTVLTNNFTDVIRVQATLSATAGLPIPLSLGTIDYYLAKGVGIIENVANLNNTQLGLNNNDKYEIQSWEIK